MRYFSSDGERIGSDPSKLLEEQLLFLLREALQQALIEDSGSIRQGTGDFDHDLAPLFLGSSSGKIASR